MKSGGSLLERVEHIGNRFPDPVTLFVIGGLVVLMVSQLGASLGWFARHPQSGEIIYVTSLLSGTGLQWVWLSLVRNFTGFAPLGVVLVAMLGIGVSERTGFIGAVLKLFVGFVPRSLVTPGLALAGVMSSIAADAGFVVLPPVAAAIFGRLGRPPVVGVALAYAAVAGGFSANLFVTALDPMLAGATQQAATLIDADATVSVTANYFFLAASAIMITVVLWGVTARWVEPRFSQSDIRDQIREGQRASGEVSSEEGASSSPEVSSAEKRGVAFAALSMFLVSAGLLGMVLIPGAPLHGAHELRPGVFVPRWAQALIPMIFVLFLVPGIVFGGVTKRIAGDRDVARMMTDTMASMGSYIVLAFFCGQFVAWFAESGLGTIMAIRGIQTLAQLDLPRPLLVVAIIFLTAGLNLFIGSASAKWFLLAPVFVPLFLGLGVSPELTQAAYRVGDSATNSVAPLNPYLVIIIVFMRRYLPGAGIGSVVSLMLPYSAVLLVTWTLMLLTWSGLGIPLGPDNGPLFIDPMTGP